LFSLDAFGGGFLTDALVAKIGYDLLLYRAFRKLKPPEER
jgi:hypothetical protein